MMARQLKPRCSIEILNVDGQVVPILEEGAIIEPVSAQNDKYREYWTEEEDLFFTYRQATSAPDGVQTKIEYTDSIHVDVGYELVVRPKARTAILKVNYFMVLPSVSEGVLSLIYEPKSVTVSSSLRRGLRLGVEIELQDGFSEERGRPHFKLLRVLCR